MNHFLTLQSVDDILSKIKAFAPVGTESLPLASCFGRTLAEAFLSPEDLPGFARSTMDGFAVRAKDVFGASEGNPALLDYLGECVMGEVPSLCIGAGQTARIWTGGMLPQGADAVVMLEYSRELSQNQIELTRPVAPFDHIIGKDEDATKGQELLGAGTLLRAQELGLLAGLGINTAVVRRRPKVAVISSGDEIVPCDSVPKLGQVRDINSTTLTAFATSVGAESRHFGLASDDQEILQSLVKEALAWADVVLLSGGSSAGQRDYTLKVLEEISGSAILAHGVAISPGKPLILAKVAEKSLWGLPGHVASALVCAEVFIRPLLGQLLGAKKVASWKNTLKARMTRPVASAQGRRDYIRVAIEDSASLNSTANQGADCVNAVPTLSNYSPAFNEDSLPWARPIMGKSGLISTLVLAHGLAICPEDQEGLRAGQIVEVQLLN